MFLKLESQLCLGTGAESSRTCVLTNNKTGKKLGMNSDFSVYDLIVMDPDLTKTVDKNQYFYSGMDSFIHSFESINGKYKMILVTNMQT